MPRRRFLIDAIEKLQATLEDFITKKKERIQQEGLVTPQHMEIIFTYYNKGLSLTEISKATGIPRPTIYTWIQRVRRKQTGVQPSA